VSDKVPTDEIERIVGVSRHDSDHIGRAVSDEQQVYILHSKECLDSGIDLRECEFSVALDLGINPLMWGPWEDVPVVLALWSTGRLIPLRKVPVITDEQWEAALAEGHARYIRFLLGDPEIIEILRSRPEPKEWQRKMIADYDQALAEAEVAHLRRVIMTIGQYIDHEPAHAAELVRDAIRTFEGGEMTVSEPGAGGT
jgi:hypothetical protein